MRTAPISMARSPQFGERPLVSKSRTMIGEVLIGFALGLLFSQLSCMPESARQSAVPAFIYFGIALLIIILRQ
jgi:phosphate/sulfate permease